MPVLVLKPGTLGAVFRKQSTTAKRAIEGAAKIAAQRGRSLMVQRTPVDRGQAKNAWRVRRSPDGDGWILINEAPHAGILEAGARPHPVSPEGVEALRVWVRRHIPVVEVHTPGKGMHKALATKREATDPNADIAAAIEEIVEAIVWKLRTKGQKGLFFTRDALPELRGFVGEEVVAAVARHVGGIGNSGATP